MAAVGRTGRGNDNEAGRHDRGSGERSGDLLGDRLNRLAEEVVVRLRTVRVFRRLDMSGQPCVVLVRKDAQRRRRPRRNQLRQDDSEQGQPARVPSR